MTVNLNWASKENVNQWQIRLRNKRGKLSYRTTDRLDFAEAAADAYLIKNSLNGSLTNAGWKIESISLVEGRK